jgi:hypothetical protein
VQKRIEQEARSYHQDDRECELRCHEHGSESRACACDGCADVFLDRCREISAGELQCRQQANDYPGTERNKRADGNDAEVDGDFAEPWQGTRSQPQECLYAPNGDGDPNQAASNREQYTLCEKATGQTRAVGSKGSTNTHFALAVETTHEEQVGRIQPRDQQ